MSSIATPPAAPSGTIVEYGQFIEGQLEKTRAQVKWVEIAGGLMTLLVAVLSYVIAVAVIDSWVLSTGLNGLGRWLCLLGLLGLGGGLFVWKVFPAVMRGVNPVYAAYTIEQSRPTLKNGLINFLFLRQQPDRLSPAVYQAVQQRAATELTQVHAEDTVDRSVLIKLGYILLGLICLIGVYKLASPKDPFRSWRRMAFPWANIQPPSRVSIDELQPGDVELFQGQYVDVTAVVRGIRSGEAVTLYYSTLDGQIVDRPVELRRPEDGYRFAASFPAQDGLHSDAEYYVRAGDAVTTRYRATVRPAPAIVVRSVELDYPRYTGLARTVQDRGDVKALEGTQVTIRAEANQTIGQAWLDLGCDGVRDSQMVSTGSEARVTFPLRLKGDGSPEHTCYQVRFQNDRGQENVQPIRHLLEVVADLPPLVKWTAPAEPRYELPRNGVVTLGLEAEDADFALSQVTVRFEVKGRALPDVSLLKSPQAGAFHGQWVFDADRFPSLRGGDEVHYWAVVADNKQPQPGVTQSERRVLVITDPVNGKERQRQQRQAERDQQRLQRGDGQPADGGAGNADPSAEEQATQERGGKNADNPDDATTGAAGDTADSDPSDDGAAGEPGDAAPDAASGRRADPGDEREQSQPGDDAPQDDQPSAEEASEGGAGEEQRSDGGKTGSKKQNQPGAGADEGKDSDDPSESSADDDAEHASDPQQGGGGERQKKPGADKHGENAAGSPEKQDKPQPGARQQPGAAKSPERRIDPETESGDAIERINEHREQQAKPGQQPQPPAGQQPKQPQPDQQQPGQQGKQPGQQKQPGAGPQPEQEGQPNADQVQQQPEKQGGSGPGQAGKQPGNDRGQPPPADQAPGDAAPPPDGAEGADAPSGADAAGNMPPQAPNQDPSDAESEGSDGDGGENEADAQNAPQKPAAQGNKPQRGSQTPSGEGESSQADEGQTDVGEQADQPSGGGRGDRAQTGTPVEKKDSPEEEESNSEGGNPDHEQGESGSGESNHSETGSTPPPNEARRRSKTDRGHKRDGMQRKPEEAKDLSTDEKPKESDSEGGESGDKSGGGQEGGGQKANREGTGGAGNNTAAEEGASEAEGNGTGRTGNDPGDRAAGKEPNGGAQKQQTGPGSRQQPGGNQAGGAADGQGRQPQPQAGQKPPAANQGSDEGESEPSEQPAGNRNQGGNRPGQEANGAAPPRGAGPRNRDADAPGAPAGPQAGGEPGGDEANLEYARRSTELAVEHLRDQLERDEPDQELLDRLGWTREDMERFVRRWDEMKRQAQQQGPQGDDARRRMQNELRGLGLRPQGTKLGRETLEKEKASPSARSSRRSEPPPEYAEQYKAYSQGKAKGRGK